MNKNLPLFIITSAVVFPGCFKADPVKPVADTTAPILSEITAVSTPVSTHTSLYMFNSDEAGSIIYGGGCDSDTADAVQGDNTITLDTFANGDYNSCTLTVKDANNNTSDALDITPFTVALSAHEQCEVNTFRNAQAGSDTTINWQKDTVQFVTAGVYSRVKQLADGRLILVYSDGPNALYRISDDNGDTWGAQMIAASPSTDQHYTNAEFIELSSGTWIYAYNARANNAGNSVNFEIKTVKSTDQGLTWTNETLVYAAGDQFDNGVWEPALLELPSKELQIYFANEFPYSDHSQEITVRRSYDEGVSWTAEEAVSYRSNSRDGMAVPILLNDQSSIVFSIEDNGIEGNFKPVTIRTTLGDNWSSGTVDAGSSNRARALVPASRLASSAYGGAPYLDQFPNGETLISIQSSQCREGDGLEQALMRVYIGDNQATDFSFASTPFTTELIKPTGNALWSSLIALDDATVMATSSINTGDDSTPNGVYIVKGSVTRN